MTLLKRQHGGYRVGDGSISAAKHGESRQRVVRIAAQSKRKQRNCLKCQTSFTSSGPENRICDKCKSGYAFNGGVIDVGVSCGSRIGVKRT